ncbi:MAG: Eco57I restriction-modification methylase domain-containing protein, partial [Rhodoferax sp.]|nr:Eco57I restriction-modification methylase domain-containing protein [Rhodoferax sp.]
PWQLPDAAGYINFESTLRSIYQGLSAVSTINEAQTEALVINKVLVALGWGDDTLPQVNLSGKRRQDVPDCLLFANSAQKARALAETKDQRRYRHGLVILEAKRWLRPLDRGDASEAFDPDAPSSQMLRYLSRAELASERAIKWGILTNGNVWRLYWQDARSRSEEFFEVDVAEALGVQGMQNELIADQADTALGLVTAAHALRLFYVFFQRSAFLPQDWLLEQGESAGRTFHAYALNEARLYEERVSQDLGARVFADIFPQLADALARSDLQAATQETGFGQFRRRQFTPAYLDEVREAALVLLYRLLFLFYAEDRHLLPVRDARYAAYSVRRIREDVRDKVEAGGAFSRTVSSIWLRLNAVIELIDEGEDDLGMPAYNGGLFNRARAPLLNRTKVPDRVMAPIIDALSRRRSSTGSEQSVAGWINYRDLAVAHLGSIYERLLEYSLVHQVQAKDDDKDQPEIDRISALPASFARKVSGSYYTHDDLVHLILRESVGVLVHERMDAFEAHLKKLGTKSSLNPGDWDALDAKDPASQILELKICDPAMGSGHFLVALVDDLADRVLEAIAAATLQVSTQPWSAHLLELGQPWVSPLVARIAYIRGSIKTTAKNHGWAVTDAQLDDRHIVRRMILKKTIFGVDKNPMAVELAKTALWLHTFTVGAPLSFLDHHLRTGDSLHGEQLSIVQRNLEQLGALLMQSEFDRLALAAKNIAQVADLTDVDIAEAQLSKQLATEAATEIAPIHAMLDFWRAMRWLVPGWPVAKMSHLPKLLKANKDKPNPILDGILRLLDPVLNLVGVLNTGKIAGNDAATQAANALMVETRALAARETFFHWWTSFPTVFGTGSKGGFDAVIGNPPWDMLQMQEVEWFSERVMAIATQLRAADRKRLIAELPTTNRQVWAQFQAASTRADQEQFVVRTCGDYPMLAEGRSNLYKLFVERAQALTAPNGLVALLVPSGIAADKGASAFFRSLSSTGRLGALFDFENKKVFFPDVHASFKFCTLVFGGIGRTFDQTRCAFYLHHIKELEDPARVLKLKAIDFQSVNPNTGAAPIFRSQRDADITLKLYANHPVLVRQGEISTSKGKQPDLKAWPVKFYQGMFNMTSDSKLFMKRSELGQHGWQHKPLNRWEKENKLALPLYVGRMIHQYDHRHASVTVNESNLQNAALGSVLSVSEKSNPNTFPNPQYWVDAEAVPATLRREWVLGFRDIARSTDVRTMIAAFVPGTATGNTLPLLINETLAAGEMSLVLANLNSIPFDYIARQKAQSTHLNWYIVEQLPVIAPARFNDPLPAAFAAAMRAAQLMNGHHPHPTVADFVVPQVLALSYTAHDMAPLARDLGYVDAVGLVLPPFIWNEEERRARLAALDALFFYLYGLDADEAAYILDSFPIVREQDTRAFGRYRTQDDILAALAPLTS